MLFEERMSHDVTSSCEVLLPWQQNNIIVSLLSEAIQTSNLVELSSEAIAINDVTCNYWNLVSMAIEIYLQTFAIDDLIFGTYVTWGNNNIW